MVVFGAYIALGLALPGVLLIRALYGGVRTLAEEIALGLTLGYSLEIFAYVFARAVDAPLLVLVWPLSAYTLFIAVPRLRKHWRGVPRPGAPIWWSWSLALAVVYLVAWSAITFFGPYALTWPGLGASHVDSSFHLSLIGELKHHVPPTVPGVAGEPLFYHWFIYAHLAAGSWVTGLEPVVLLLRLAMLPMLAALVVLVGMLGHRVIGSRPGALAAVLGAMFMAAPSLYLGTNGIFTWGGIQDAAWTSPTQTFGAVLFAPVVLLLVDLLEGRSRRAGNWFLLLVFLLAVMGSKATYLPLLVVGLAAVTAVEAIRSRRLPRSPLIALGITTMCFLYAQFVLFGRAQQGVTLAPLSLMEKIWGDLTGRPSAVDLTPATAVGITSVYLLCWIVTWCGVLGLLSRPSLLLRPAVVIMLSMGAAGLGGVLLFGSAHGNQLYFLRAAYPYMAIVSVYGLFVVVRQARASRGAVAVAAGVGVLAAYLIPLLCGVEIPRRPGQTTAALYLPYVVLLGFVLLTVVVLIATRRGWSRWALALTMIACIGLPAAAHTRVLSVLHRVAEDDLDGVVRQPAAEAIPQGALAAGRWLRDHSGPDDVIATNGHCRWGHEVPCDGRHSWVAALTERRVFLEGWAYTAKNWDRWRPGTVLENQPFWDGERVRSNDAVFLAPSRESVLLLGERYGVRWLFADKRRMDPERKVDDYANLRFTSGDYAVYEIPGDLK
ncbi:hypothetical protein OG884_02715 [Streptosporangium sp. NBC_01755]|uniref:hypothetical protein n=1 Tax=unclassified Streptosporangium TaxID=2632669 RepID=UPI002DDBB2EA|nr:MULTISPECIES: hypothetical protein [unclassified Streptosporangium]WSA27656.1 hypothetical protein OIE13_07225 [Streptosporangium sp. NBC_01810]WSD00869.1 hypothetical protein OG884_02715 [Streptosporangium sp. NBC_01755]